MCNDWAARWWRCRQLTIHDDGEKAVEQGLQPLVARGDDLVKDLK